MSKPNQKDVFTAIGHIKVMKDERGIDRHRFIPKSTRYMHDQFRKIPVNTELTCTFSKHEATRSEQQLKYYWVILGYLAEHVGDTAEEIHECIMIDMFGTKKKKFNGKEYQIRQSISNRALFPKYKMVEITNYVKAVCEKLEVKIPTAEELGYVSNKVETKVDVKNSTRGWKFQVGRVVFITKLSTVITLSV